jgi:hypothetical protein
MRRKEQLSATEPTEASSTEDQFPRPTGVSVDQEERTVNEMGEVR